MGDGDRHFIMIMPGMINRHDSRYYNRRDCEPPRHHRHHESNCGDCHSGYDRPLPPPPPHGWHRDYNNSRRLEREFEREFDHGYDQGFGDGYDEGYDDGSYDSGPVFVTPNYDNPLLNIPPAHNKVGRAMRNLGFGLGIIKEFQSIIEAEQLHRRNDNQ